MSYKRLNKLILIPLIVSIFPVPSVSSLSLIKLTYDDLYTNADHVILGTVVTETDFQTYTYYTMKVENSYKNTFEETTIQILGKTLFNDYPEYRTKLSPEKQYLLFLTDTMTEYQDSKVYEVYGVTQGVFRVEDEIASNGIFNILINDDEIRIADDGHIVFKSIEFPNDMTVYDFREIDLQFYNEGGQFIGQKFNVSFIGSSNTSLGEKVSKIVRVKEYAGRSTSAKITLNMTKPGLYSIFVNGTYIEDVLIHESGYGSQGYNFSNIRIELSNLDWSTYKVVFEVSSEVSGSSEVYYRMVTNGEGDPEHNTHLNIPMVSKFKEAGTVTQWYPFGKNAMGTRKIVIWYKGLRVLETTANLGSGETNFVDLENEPSNSIPCFTLFPLIFALTLARKVWKKTSNASLSHRIQAVMIN